MVLSFSDLNCSSEISILILILKIDETSQLDPVIENEDEADSTCESLASTKLCSVKGKQ